MKKNFEDTHGYEDIIHLPHHVSTTRKHMSLHDRGAQFAPFAALTGHEEAVNETARLTKERIALTESRQEEMNQVMVHVAKRIQEEPKVHLIYFVPDAVKYGGDYQQREGRVRKIDTYARTVILTDGDVIAMKDIYDIELL